MGKGKVVFKEEGTGRLLRRGEEPAVVTYKLTQTEEVRKSKEIGFVPNNKPAAYRFTEAYLRFSERQADSESEPATLELADGRQSAGRMFRRAGIGFFQSNRDFRPPKE
jgi:hypothetical protein